MAETEREPLLKIEAIQNLAVALMRSSSGAPEAEALLLSIRPVVDEVGDPRKNLVHRLNLAEAVRNQKRFREAAELNERALTDAQDLGDMEVVGNLVGNIAICRLHEGDVRRAEEGFIQSTSIAKSLRGEMRGNAIYNRGWLRVLLGQWAEGASFLEDAAIAYREAGAVGRAGGAEALRGWCELRMGNVGEAERILEGIQSRNEVPSGSEYSDKYHLLETGVMYRPSDLTEPTTTEILENLRSTPEELVHFACALLAMGKVDYERVAREAWHALGEISLPPLASQLANECERRGIVELAPVSVVRLERQLSDLVQVT